MKKRIISPPRGGPRREARLRDRTWMSVQVELVEGRGERYWPRPGRIFAAAADHSFAELATAIDDAFARWDRSHLLGFELGDRTRIGIAEAEWEDEEPILDERLVKLSRLGIVADRPLPYFGWGAVPDQYGRAWSADDGEGQPPQDPGLTDLPPLRPSSGPRQRADC